MGRNQNSCTSARRDAWTRSCHSASIADAEPEPDRRGKSTLLALLRWLTAWVKSRGAYPERFV